jgi:hypothetical protein
MLILLCNVKSVFVYSLKVKSYMRRVRYMYKIDFASFICKDCEENEFIHIISGQ